MKTVAGEGIDTSQIEMLCQFHMQRGVSWQGQEMPHAMVPSNKKTASITIKDKYEMIILMENNPQLTHAEVARRFAIPTLTLSGIISNATNI